MALKPCIKRQIDKMHTSRQYMAFINRKAGICDSYLHCACLIMNDTVISVGMNVRDKAPKGLHAEIDALSKSLPKRKRRIITDLLVIRISSKGTKLAESRPCCECIKSMYNNTVYKIRNVIYSTKEGTIKTEKLNNMMDNIAFAHKTRNKSPKTV